MCRVNGWWLSEARRIGGEIRGFSPKAGTRVSSCRSFWSEKNTRSLPSTAIESLKPLVWPKSWVGFCLKPLVWPESGSGFASNHWFGLNQGRVLLQTIGLAPIGVGFCFKPLVWLKSWVGFASNHWFGPNRRWVLLQTIGLARIGVGFCFKPPGLAPIGVGFCFKPPGLAPIGGRFCFKPPGLTPIGGRVLLQKQYRFWVLYVRKAKTLLPPVGEQGLEVSLATGVAAEASSLRAHFFIPFERLHGQEDAEAEYEWKNKHLHRVEGHDEFAAIVQDIEERHDGG